MVIKKATQVIGFTSAGFRFRPYFSDLLKKEAISPFDLQAFDRLVWLWQQIDGLLPWVPTPVIAVVRKVYHMVESGLHISSDLSAAIVQPVASQRPDRLLLGTPTS